MQATSRARATALVLASLALLSCGQEDADPFEAHPPLGVVRQAITDTDGDGMDDGWETTNFGNLSQAGSGDFDSDGMTNLEEFQYGFIPTSKDAFADADGDRYPNIFELRRGSDPNSAASTPTANYVVNAGGGGTHTTISAAVTAANVANGAYQIIGIAPGTYAGTANTQSVVATSSKPTLLFIGLAGAAKTIIDGSSAANYGWSFQQNAVVASLTFQKTWQALWVDAPSKDVRFVDVVVRENTGVAAYASGLHVNAAARVDVVGSTFFNNTRPNPGQQIYFGSSVAGTTTNTVVWSQGAAAQSTQALVTKNGSATFTSTNCLVKDQTLTGTGNLAGTVDPKLRSDARITAASPLRAAGATIAQSRADMDGETRPASAPDIGADQYIDADADGLPDGWEIFTVGSTAAIDGAADADGDGLTNAEEYAQDTGYLVSDTDGDGISDGNEVHVYGTSPLSTDTDGDGMPDNWEVTYGLSATVANAFDDADGDGYPNVFEYARSSDPSNASSLPTPNYVVNGAGGGTHTTVLGAVTAANVANGKYQIIGIAPGTYTGADNLSNVSVAPSKPTLLFIGLQGAAKTILDGTYGTYAGWSLNTSAVVSSLTFQRTQRALTVNAGTSELRFVDLVVRNNAAVYNDTAGLRVDTATKVQVVGSTFLDNTGATNGQHIWFSGGVAATMTNTAVSSPEPNLLVSKSASSTLVTSYCFVKGQTLTGTGNLAGSVDPKLRADGHIQWNSPLRGVGGSVPQSLRDLDGETRPSAGRDIGADQFVDADNDVLADAWEITTYGNTTAFNGLADADGDGLTNAEEYALGTNMFAADTDGDGIPDGEEITLGLDPLRVDFDELAATPNNDGLIDSIAMQLGYPRSRNDDDGDGISNADELLMCTDPLRADTDGDGVPDNLDAFPLDPLKSSLTSGGGDTTPPQITLTAPWFAVAQ